MVQLLATKGHSVRRTHTTNAQLLCRRRIRISLSYHNLLSKLAIVATLLCLVGPRHKHPSFAVLANSNGAGACPGGSAAVGGLHLDSSNGRTVAQGELSQGQVSVQIGTDQLIPNAPFEVSTQTDYTISVTTLNTNGFRGILIRLGNGDDNAEVMDWNPSNLYPPNNGILKDADVCVSTNSVGVTHTSNAAKMSVSATMRLDRPGSVRLEVTLVGINDASTSVYGYNGYTLTVTGEAVAATPAPLAVGATAVPTSSPTVPDIYGTFSPTYTPPGTSSTRAVNRGSRWLLVALLLLTVWLPRDFII